LTTDLQSIVESSSSAASFSSQNLSPRGAPSPYRDP